MDDLCTRLDALEHHVQTLQQHTRTVERQLRWWRGLARGLLMLAVLTWALPAGMADDAKHEDKKGLTQRVAALEKLLTHFSRKGNDVTIKGANLHIVNGLGSTDCFNEQFEPIPNCPNGLGNLIVGYNESRTDIGGEDIRTGSHNVVVGPWHNFSRVGGVVVGSTNTISGDFAVVSGGVGNTASGEGASVSGGDFNTASGAAASVSGGGANTASGIRSSVSGGGVDPSLGMGNTAGGDLSSVSGGDKNTARGEGSAVSGGVGNTASGPFATLSGGLNRTAAGEFDWVTGTLFQDK